MLSVSMLNCNDFSCFTGVLALSKSHVFVSMQIVKLAWYLILVANLKVVAKLQQLASAAD